MTRHNLLLDSDSYKYSHFLQDPEGLTRKTFYLESRGGAYSYTVFFGLQIILKNLAQGITGDDADEAEELIRAHGEPFNREGFMHILKWHNGRIPLRIWAVPEGTVVPTKNILMRVENTDSTMPWLGGFFETMLMRVWYPTTVCTRSHFIKKLILDGLRKTSDDPDAGIAFKLHDFGARGVSSAESAGIGGLAHLVNFMGTDTVEALVYARRYYNTKVAGYSVPAAEHATILPWGKAGEVDAYANMLTQFAKPGALVAVVSDTYDLWRAIETIWGGTLREKVIASGACVIIRPDSGHPPTVVVKALQMLDAKFGHTDNSKGYRVLRHVKVIQGDGITDKSIPEIIDAVVIAGYSLDNLAFGMGGGLLQQLDRDTLKFAYKPSIVWFGDRAMWVKKEPVDDPGKASKDGYLDLIEDTMGRPITVQTQDNKPHPGSMLRLVFDNGKLLIDEDMDTIRKRAARYVPPSIAAAAFPLAVASRIA